MAYETDNLRKLREECHIQWPLHVNPHNHFIEDRIGVVIASVAGGGERIAPYLAAAANVLPEALDKLERLQDENIKLRDELAHYKQVAEIARRGLAEAVKEMCT